MAITSTRQKIASVRPADTNEAQLYVIGAGAQMDALLRITNSDTSERTYRVAHCTAAHGDTAADTDDFIAYDQPISANTTHEITIHANATETVRIKASVADKIIFHLSGNLKVVS